MSALFSFTYRSGRIRKVDLEASHGSDDGDNGLDGVAVDHGLVLLTLFLWVTRFVDDPGTQREDVSTRFQVALLWIYSSHRLICWDKPHSYCVVFCRSWRSKKKGSEPITCKPKDVLRSQIEFNKDVWKESHREMLWWSVLAIFKLCGSNYSKTKNTPHSLPSACTLSGLFVSTATCKNNDKCLCSASHASHNGTKESRIYYFHLPPSERLQEITVTQHDTCQDNDDDHN